MFLAPLSVGWCAIMARYYAVAISKGGRIDLLVYSTPLLLGELEG